MDAMHSSTREIGEKHDFWDRVRHKTFKARLFLENIVVLKRRNNLRFKTAGISEIRRIHQK